MYKRRKQTPNHDQLIEREVERSISRMIDQKMRKADITINSLFLGASKKAHSDTLNKSNLDFFGASNNQLLSHLGSAIQRCIFRNL